MRVLYFKDTVINVDDGCPSIERMLKAGAEEIPIEIFGGYPNFASSENTRKVDGTWTFTADKDALDAQQLEALKSIKRSDRDNLIIACEWLVQRHMEQEAADIPTTLTEARYAELLAYRQNLRDWPETEGWPNAPIPTPPSWM